MTNGPQISVAYNSKGSFLFLLHIGCYDFALHVFLFQDPGCKQTPSRMCPLMAEGEEGPQTCMMPLQAAVPGSSDHCCSHPISHSKALAKPELVGRRVDAPHPCPPQRDIATLMDGGGRAEDNWSKNTICHAPTFYMLATRSKVS